jgi:glycosyltransferase involved in cell wall biosynthesis
MTHIAICSDGIFPAEVGGMQRHTDLLVRSLAETHPELAISVLHTHPGKQLFADLPSVNEIPIAPRPDERQYLLECYDLSGRMADALRGLPDAVIYAQGLTVWKNASDFTPRLINNPHGLESFQAISLKDKLIGFPFRHAFRHIWRRSRHVVSLGGRLTTILQRHVPEPGRRIVVLPNGVRLPAEPCRRRTEQPSTCSLLFVGRFAANKGIKDLLAAMSLLTAEGLGDRFSLHLVGTGPLYDELRGGNRLPNVIFHGGVNDADLHRLYCESDLFVLPTLFEGMPTVVLEAMARELPIIVTDVGATRELVDDRNGCIIPTRSPRDLADALKRFAALPSTTRAALGAASLQKVLERFTWDQVAEAHHAVFIRLAKELAGRIRPNT